MTRLALAGAALALLAAPLVADTASDGYALSGQSMPGGYSSDGMVTCTLSGGDLVVYDGTDVNRYTPAGAHVQYLGSTPTKFAAWILPTPDGTAVVLGHSGGFPGPGGEIYRAELDGSGIDFVAQVYFSYDAVFLSDTDLLVTADRGPGGVFNSFNDIVHVDVPGGVITTIGRVDFPSGPLALKSNGDLFYADQATGNTDILVWSAAEVAAAVARLEFLDYTNADTWASGYGPAASMRFDPANDRLYLAESDFTTFTSRILRARPNPAKAEEIAVTDALASNLEFVSGGGPANLQAYQPGDGSNLKYNTNDFFVSAALHQRIAPARPVLTASGPGTLGVGSVILDVSGAPPDGTLFLVFGPQSSMSAVEMPFSHPGYLFHTRFAPGTIRRTPFLLPVDSSGNGSFSLFNPGSLNGLFGYQFLVGDAGGTFLGSSTLATF